MGLGIAVTFVMVMTVPINYLLNELRPFSGRAPLDRSGIRAGGESEIDLSFLSFIVLSP